MPSIGSLIFAFSALLAAAPSAASAPVGSPPTPGQIGLLILAVTFFAVGGLISLARLRYPDPRLRLSAKVCMYGGLTVSLAVLIWHSTLRGSWLPIGDNFDALIWLALLLAAFVLYTQRTHPLAGLDWFVMPIVILLLLGAGHFGAAEYRSYGHNIWLWVHMATAYGGAAAFAVAAATGAMYVLASRRLRRKLPAGPLFGNLERLERLTMVSVTLGFALLSIGLVTGLIRMLASDGKRVPLPHLAVASLAWLVYAVVLHTPINPRFRGRRAAALSIFGFLLMIATLLAVQRFPGGQG